MSETEIYNGALILLGERPILDYLGNTSTPAKLIKRVYPDVRDGLLADHPWRFASRRVALAPSGTSPEWGFTYLFTYPADWIRLVKVQDGVSHKTADSGILANENPLYLEYVYRCTNSQLFSREFCRVLKHRLAVELCVPLTNDKDLYDRLVSREEKIFRKATFVSASQTTDHEEQDEAEDPWLDVR